MVLNDCSLVVCFRACCGRCRCAVIASHAQRGLLEGRPGLMTAGLLAYLTEAIRNAVLGRECVLDVPVWRYRDVNTVR
jgi:hypothetical protein